MARKKKVQARRVPRRAFAYEEDADGHARCSQRCIPARPGNHRRVPSTLIRMNPNGRSARQATRVRQRPPALLILLAAVSLAGCASAGDIKPGAISGLAGQGYLKTTEGFGIVTSGCSDAELWAVALTTARTLKPSSWQVGGPLVILSADERAGVIRAEDPRTFVGTTSYVGIFLRRLDGELRLIEVSAFWKNRIAATANPWETELLAAMRARLPCVVPSERALQSGTRP